MSTNTKQTEWQAVGDICIDTATLLLCDPLHAQEAADWAFDAAHEEHAAGAAAQTNKHGMTTALTVLTGLGDGCYPVEVRHEDVPGWGRRIAEVRIKFLPYPNLGGGKCRENDEMTDLESKLASADEKLKKARELRDDAIHALIDCEMEYSDALEEWSVLWDEKKSLDKAVA